MRLLWFVVEAQLKGCSGAKYGYHDKGKNPHTDKGVKGKLVLYSANSFYK